MTTDATDAGAKRIPPPSWAGAFSVVFGARVLIAAIAFLGTVLVARMLGPSGYGQFARLIALMHIAIVFGGPALDTSLVRYTAKFHDPERDRSLGYFRAILRIKYIINGLLLLVGLVIARPAATLIFRDSELGDTGPFLVFLAIASAVGATLWGYAQACFQSREEFHKYAGFELLHAVIRWGAVVSILVLGPSTLVYVMCAHAAAPFLMILLTWACLPAALTSLAGPFAGAVGQLVHFAKWVLAASVFTVLANRIDVLMLGFFHLPEVAIGHYGAAVALVTLGDLMVMTLFSVLLPKASKLEDADAVAAFLKGFRMPAILVGVASLPVLALSGPVARFVFGQTYSDAGVLFAILFVGTVISMGSAPAGTAVYGMGRSHIIASLEATKLLLTLALGVWLVPRYGAYGMAVTVAGAKGAIGLATCFAARRAVVHMRNEEPALKAV